MKNDGKNLCFLFGSSKKVFNFAAQKERQFVQLKIISPSGAPKGSILEGRYLF